MQALQAGFGGQAFAQGGFDPGAGIGFVNIRRPANATEQGAEPGLRHALRMNEELQQTQGDIDQRLGRQRRPGDEHKVPLQRSPAGADGLRMQRGFQCGFQQPPARRQVSDGNSYPS